MRQVSEKTAARAAECREMRRALVAQVGHCELCGHDPRRPRLGKVCWALACHEILNGALRQKCLDKRHSLLCLCWWCNSNVVTDKKLWPEARQLAALLKSRPQDYDLAAHNLLANPMAPQRVTQEEVDGFLTARSILSESTRERKD